MLTRLRRWLVGPARREHVLSGAILGLVIVLCWALAARAAEEIAGRATVIDGDTIEIRGERIRLQGIDAPESWQSCWDAAEQPYRCGRAATEALDAFLALSRPTRCAVVDRDRYGRHVAECARADGEGVGAWMVRSGHALDYKRYSKGAYADEERQAAEDKVGMWQGRFDPPWDARSQ